MAERDASKSKNDMALQAQSAREKKEKGKWFNNKGRRGYNNLTSKGNQQKGNSLNQRRHHTKVNKEVVLLVEEMEVVKNLTKVTFNVSIIRSMVITLLIV